MLFSVYIPFIHKRAGISLCIIWHWLNIFCKVTSPLILRFRNWWLDCIYELNHKTMLGHCHSGSFPSEGALQQSDSQLLVLAVFVKDIWDLPAVNQEWRWSCHVQRGSLHELAKYGEVVSGRNTCNKCLAVTLSLKSVPLNPFMATCLIWIHYYIWTRKQRKP